ncbi:MAG: MauE/DoxX family redox-associated membrane protein [Ilumatobacteraceae bacterium]
MVGPIAAVVLGLAFVLAGASKIAMGEQWPVQARDLGAPAAVIPVVPWTELVIGALLVTQFERATTAVVALAVLVVFTGLLVLRLAQGRRPPCACFGAWTATPIGPLHVARNVGLMALAVLAIVA